MENSDGIRDPSMLLVTEKFLVQIMPKGDVARVLLLTDLVRIEYAKNINKALFVTVSKKQDWLFTWKSHDHNRPGMPVKIIGVIGTLWKFLRPQHDELPIKQELTSDPDLTERIGEKNAKQTFDEYVKTPGDLPRSYPPPKGDGRSKGAKHEIVSFTLHLTSPDEDLGAGICSGDDGSVLVRALARDGCFERHGVPLGTIVELAGVRIQNEEQLRTVKNNNERLGRTEIELKMTDCEWDNKLYTDEIDLGSHSSQASDVYTYSVATQGRTIQTPGASKAVLIGIDYRNSEVALSGARHRLNFVKDFLMAKGYHNQKVLCDDPQAGGVRPTKANILKSFQWLSRNAQPSDNLFLYITGHSVNIPDTDDIESGEDGAMAPVDYRATGFVTCTEVQQLLLNQLPEGCRLFILSDFELGGTLVDLAHHIEILPGGDYEVGENVTDKVRAQVVLVTLMATDPDLPEVGLTTSLFFKCFQESEDPTLQMILDCMRERLGSDGIGAALYPHISCTKQFDARGERFSDPPRGMVVVPNLVATPPPSVTRSSRRGSRTSSQGLAKGPHQVPPLPPWLVGEHEGVDFLTAPFPNRRRISAGPGSGTPTQRHVISGQYRQRLITYYRYYNPEMLHRVSSMLIQYKGQEERLFAELVAIYGEEPHNIRQDHLPPNWTKVQTSKGEIFYRNEVDGRRQWEVPAFEYQLSENSDAPPPPGYRPPSRR
eukprot:TRINITY_DN46742_c0_g1_i1.p1 TRINITY_DN46742_c0_g1~~TRINITY_DN46742_c0_g1_i1.p1  ORF type:complete len:778 (+),score=82.27 TRINITY_DN46742_c0_g1_i1:197-2335(+)